MASSRRLEPPAPGTQVALNTLQMTRATKHLVCRAALVTAVLLPLTGCDTIGPLVLQTTDKTAEAYEVLSQEWIRWALRTPHSTSPPTLPMDYPYQVIIKICYKQILKQQYG